MTIPSRVCGIYFLFDGPELTWIGQTIDGLDRVRNHENNGRPFTHYLFAPVLRPSELDFYESVLLYQLKPRDNKKPGRLGWKLAAVEALKVADNQATHKAEEEELILSTTTARQLRDKIELPDLETYHAIDYWENMLTDKYGHGQPIVKAFKRAARVEKTLERTELPGGGRTRIKFSISTSTFKKWLADYIEANS